MVDEIVVDVWKVRGELLLLLPLLRAYNDDLKRTALIPY